MCPQTATDLDLNLDLVFLIKGSVLLLSTVDISPEFYSDYREIGLLSTSL